LRARPGFDADGRARAWLLACAFVRLPAPTEAGGIPETSGKLERARARGQECARSSGGDEQGSDPARAPVARQGVASLGDDAPGKGDNQDVPRDPSHLHRILDSPTFNLRTPRSFRGGRG